MSLPGGLLLLMLLALALGKPQVSSPGCQSWVLGSRDPEELCCKICKPGNVLVKDCGKDQHALCTPCESGSYVPNSNPASCVTCSTCKDHQQVKRPCTPTSDAVCECIAGFQCGDATCSFCQQECRVGEERINRTCHDCPNGTFSDRADQKCVPWSSRCLEPNQMVIKGGSRVHDIICGPTDNSAQVLVPTLVFCIFVIIASMMAIGVRHTLRQGRIKRKDALPKPPNGLQQGVPAEECSFCFPQQEQGDSSSSSSSSITSVDSEQRVLFV